ncbi:MAG: Ig-like domain-containing protein, partial [Anaerolineae bacterium]
MASGFQQWVRQHRVLLLILAGLLSVGILAVALVAVFGPRPPAGQAEGTTVPVLVDTPTAGTSRTEVVTVSQEGGAVADSGDGQLVIQLSEGKAQLQEVAFLPPASGEPLTDEEIAQILARLPDLVAEPEDQVEFQLPEDSPPPPRTGETIDEPFPPPEAPVVPEQVEAGPLEVLRYGPEGEIPLAPFLTVTFSQPMVPLASLAALAAEDVPVQLEPSLPGTWKWLGTKTLTFEYDSDAVDRLPMATVFQATVPAGTESATGGVLAETVAWTFSTPPPVMIDHLPSDSPQPLEPVFLVAFDQRIEPDAVLPTIEVKAGGQAVAIRLATGEELEADKAASRLAERTGEGRWLAFVAQEPLPVDAPVSVTIGPGTPSAEGSLVTTVAQQYDFRTYAPLRIVDHGCSWSRDECPPLTPFFIE